MSAALLSWHPDGSLDVGGARVLPFIDDHETFFICSCVMARTVGYCSHSSTAYAHVRSGPLQAEAELVEAAVAAESDRWADLRFRLAGGVL